MKPKLHIRQERCNNTHIGCDYAIFLGTKQIGELVYKKQNKIFILSRILIYPEYRKQGYGKQVIEYILSNYKIDCIVGETLKESKSFWNKCITEYGGEKRKVFYCSNCSNSFVIPKHKIDNHKLYDLLELAYKIDI